ncbi:17784_t:CDS:1 [Funneliformis geosporum]|uniref:8562_t:CDS:1 n=1 Tax=Funneliformis geosporum TaxID=1117311 RepID=A0A9W4WPR4_9GLOM|nr:17784_t:CDS:1 [Funneliformis geosporum]CAI2177057.1 8562_t:CDS:1 [Funneliformis geosporum]
MRKIIEFIIKYINNDKVKFNQEVARLLQAFIIDGHLNVPHAIDPVTMYNELSSTNRPPRTRLTHTRGVLRVTVSQQARQIQINDYNVISRATDMLKKAMTLSESEDYQYLSSQVNFIIKRQS